MTTVKRAEWWLKLLLRAVGLAMATAIVPTMMPLSWMAAVHAWAGLGEMPRTPVFEYLARSLSAFYAVLGGLLVVVSFDVRRHAVVIAYLGVVALAGGFAATAMELLAGMPLWWLIVEGPSLVPLGAALLVLNARARG